MTIQNNRQIVASLDLDLLFGAVADPVLNIVYLRWYVGQLARASLPNFRRNTGCYSLPCFTCGAAPEGWVMVGMTDCEREPA